jgi:hypothetical protein
MQPTYQRRDYPDIDQVIDAAIITLATHPLVKEPPILFPPKLDRRGRMAPPEKAYINSYRSYGGSEVIEPGITLSVFPFHSPYSMRTGIGNYLKASKAQEFKPANLGKRSDSGDNGPFLEGLMRLVVEIKYRDTTNLDQETDVLYDYADNNYLGGLPHDFRVRLADLNSLPQLNTGLSEALVKTHPVRDSIKIKVNVGEKLIRNWVSNLILVLQDTSILNPLGVRSTQVVLADYPTSTWSSNGENIAFHTGWVLWELSYYLPPSWESSSGNAITQRILDIYDKQSINLDV